MATFSRVPAVLSAIFLVLAVSSLPYGYYTFLRVFLTITAIYYIYFLNKLNRIFFIWLFILIAIVFNPIFPVYLEKEQWIMIDLFVAALLAIFIIKLQGKNS